jgi:antitoxin HicB
MKQAHVGSDFDDLLREEGLLEECEAGALRRLLALQIEQEMKRRKISRATLARRMKTPRENLDQLFSEDPSLVTLQFVEKVAAALGRKLRIELA